MLSRPRRKKNYTKCEVKDKELRTVRYFVGNVQRSPWTNGDSASLIIDISVAQDKINEKYLVLVARHMNARFCKESKLIVGIFDSKDVARFYDMNLQEARNHYRGEYLLDRITGKEKVTFVRMPDYNGNYNRRVTIDLSATDPTFAQANLLETGVRTVCEIVADPAQYVDKEIRFGAAFVTGFNMPALLSHPVCEGVVIVASIEAGDAKSSGVTEKIFKNLKDDAGGISSKGNFVFTGILTKAQTLGHTPIKGVLQNYFMRILSAEVR